MLTNHSHLRLSEHFVLDEFVRSATAQRLHIDNTPQLCHVSRLIALCEHVLEPLRRSFGPLIINSGYRCAALNRAVGGVPHSQHLRGEAADVRTNTLQQARRMYDFVRQNLVFDQVILERSARSGSVWLHVSYRKDEQANRCQALHLSVASALPVPFGRITHTDAALTAACRNDMPRPMTLTCRCCGRTLPMGKFALLPSGNRRQMCNHCRWVQQIEPSRRRSLVRAV